MKFKRLISGTAAIALAVSSLSFSAFANPDAKPGEIGFETGQERNDSDDFDFLDKPYSLTSGDYYMGISVQTGTWTHRNALGDVASETGNSTKNDNGDKITGINQYTSWAHLYGGGYASITKDANGVPLKSVTSAYGPTGIFYGENEGENGLKEYAQLHDAKIGNNGTYTIGISGYNFKADTANNKDSDNGNGINILYITSNIKYLEKNGVEIKNPVLKLYNTKESYEAKKPYKSIPAGYWLETHGDNKSSYRQYTQYMFTNIWTENNKNNTELGKVVSFDKKYENHNGYLDVFGISGFTGSKDDSFKSKFAGCSFLPEYAMEITFEVNAPDSMMHKITSGKSLGNVVEEVGKILNNQAELESIQKNNPTLTVEQIKEKLTAAYNAGKSAYDKYGNYKSLSKSLITEPSAAVDKALADLKAVCSELGILIWGEVNGYIETAEGMDFTKYTAKSWKAVEDAIAEAKELRAKYENGEAVTQAQIDAAALKLKNAIDGLKEVTEKVDSSSGLGYIEFKDTTGKYQWYNDGKNYQNVTAKTVDVKTSDDGNGKTYTVKAKCDGTAKGLADANIEIQGLIKAQDTATVTIDEIKLDGKKQKLTGVPYTQAVDKANAYVPLYSADVTSIPDDAYTSPDGKCAKDASPQALSQGAKNDYAALDTEWKEITVKFTVNWDDGTVEEEGNTSENPSTAGGIAVASTLIAVLGAGYVISRKRTK